MDSMDHFWSQAVLNFYLEEQVEALRSARKNVNELRRETSWRDIASALAVVLLIGSGFWFWQRPRLSVEQRLIAGLREKVSSSYGADWGKESLGLDEMARGTGDDAVAEFARIYQASVFRDRPLETGQLTRLKRLLGQVGKVRKSG